MYGHQKLLRIRNIIDIYNRRSCGKCGIASYDPIKRWGFYSRNDVVPVRDYYKKISFVSVKMFFGHQKVCHINFLDNKVKILHSEYFRNKEFLCDDTIYLLPFLKVLHIYSRKHLSTTLRKLLIENYNEFLIKAMQTISDSGNARYGSHISNYSPSEKLIKMFQKAQPLLLNEETKEFFSDSIYKEYQGKEINIIVEENSQDKFLESYTTSDKDNYLIWLLVDDFTKWYIKNIESYVVLCSECLGRKERRRVRRYVSILEDTFFNKEIQDLIAENEATEHDKKIKSKEAKKETLKKYRPKAYEAQYGVTKVTIKDGQKTIVTDHKKK
jgi:hypothetical protein